MISERLAGAGGDRQILTLVSNPRADARPISVSDGGGRAALWPADSVAGWPSAKLGSEIQIIRRGDRATIAKWNKSPPAKAAGSR